MSTASIQFGIKYGNNYNSLELIGISICLSVLTIFVWLTFYSLLNDQLSEARKYYHIKNNKIDQKYGSFNFQLSETTDLDNLSEIQIATYIHSLPKHKKLIILKYVEDLGNDTIKLS